MTEKTGRIEYIDAMRGMTMILVVYSHVCNYCLGDKTMGFNDIFFLFRLPCFFFLSGWLFEKMGQRWDNGTVMTVVRHKFMVQIVPTAIFLLLLAPPPLFFSKLGATKGGYWFTFALFEFFLLCIFSERYLKKWGGLFALIISILAFAYDISYNQYFRNMGLLTNALGFIGFTTWRYYLFFYIGTWVKRHFEQFQGWISHPILTGLVIVGFCITAMNPSPENGVLAYTVFTIGGILGMTMVFAFFRHFASAFSKQHWPGRCLQYIGTRTLDIYLLHYFLLPRFLLAYAPRLQESDNRFLEMLAALSIALLVVTVCLIISYTIRLNPTLGHLLFGVKRIKTSTS